MKYRRLRPVGLLLIAGIVLGGAVCCSREAAAAKPYIWYVYPAGGRQGTTVEVLVQGKDLQESEEAYVSGEGVTAKILEVLEPDESQQKPKRADASVNPDRVRVEVKIAADAPPGQRDLRLITSQGVTNRFCFIVGQLPELVEEESNSSLAEAQALESLPMTVNGRIFQADRDAYRFRAAAGQKLVFRFQGRDLLPYVADAVPGWLQASLTLYDAEGRELAYVDDFRVNPDPVLIYDVEEDGEYVAVVKDALYRGRDDMVYRLTIGAVPFLTDIYPLGAKRGGEAEIQLFGANLPTDRLTLDVPADATFVLPVEIEHQGILSNRRWLAVDDFDSVVEKEPNNTAEQASPLEVPVAVNGRIGQPGDVDCFRITAEKDQRLVVDVLGRRLGTPLDAIVSLRNAQGRDLVENDDTVDDRFPLVTHHADSYLNYTFTAAGEYVLRLRDVQSHGGRAWAYRLVLTPPRQDFSLMVTPDVPVVPAGGSVPLAVHALRRDGFDGDIEVAVKGLPEGFVASPAVIPGAQTQTRLTITAPEQASADSGLLRPTFEGTAQVDGKPITRQAQPAEEVIQAFIYVHRLPVDDLLLAVTHPVPLRVTANLPDGKVVEIPRGGNVQVKLKVERGEGTAGPVKIEVDNPPKGLSARATPVPPDQNESTLTITAQQVLAPGFRDNLVLKASVKVGKETVAAWAPAK